MKAAQKKHSASEDIGNSRSPKDEDTPMTS